MKSKKNTNYVKAFQKLRDSGLGAAWDNVICVCRQIMRDDPCSVSCKEFHDESLPNERDKK